MAASSKPTAIHFFLIGFVLLTVVWVVAWYVEHKYNLEHVAEWDKAKKDAQESTRAASTALEQIEVLKKLMGNEFEKVGETEPDNPNTVVGAARKNIADFGGDLASPSYSATLAKVAEAKKNSIAERDDLRAKLTSQEAEYASLEAKYAAMVAEQKTARDKSEADVVDLNKTKEEQLASKDKDIADQKKAIGDLQLELEQERDANAKKTKELEQKVVNLQVINRKISDELNNVKQVSFEVPDGVVRWVDNVNRLVWINLGEMDNLKKRTSFSVYTKSNAGIARGPEDIKGGIEVTRLLGPHLAEARILKDDIFNPMAAGDPIYTPLWSPGRSDRFAFIGKIDTDGDKQSDRELLHEIIATAGAKIDTEVDDEGKRVGGKISELTKFLVLGEIPKLEDEGDEEQKKVIQKIYEELKALRAEAQEHGVRIISLSDFLNYIGFTTQRRLFRPGESAPYILKEGARSASVDESVGKRESSGNTAGVYSDRKKPAAKAAPSNTRSTGKLFRQGGVGGS